MHVLLAPLCQSQTQVNMCGQRACKVEGVADEQQKRNKRCHGTADQQEGDSPVAMPPEGAVDHATQHIPQGKADRDAEVKGGEPQGLARPGGLVICA